MMAPSPSLEDLHRSCPIYQRDEIEASADHMIEGFKQCFPDGEPQHNQPAKPLGTRKVEFPSLVTYFRPVLSKCSILSIVAAHPRKGLETCNKTLKATQDLEAQEPKMLEHCD